MTPRGNRGTNAHLCGGCARADAEQLEVRLVQLGLGLALHARPHLGDTRQVAHTRGTRRGGTRRWRGRRKGRWMKTRKPGKRKGAPRNMSIAEGGAGGRGRKNANANMRNPPLPRRVCHEERNQCGARRGCRRRLRPWRRREASRSRRPPCKERAKGRLGKVKVGHEVITEREMK